LNENGLLRLKVCCSHIGRSLMLHGKNDFAERSKILLDTDLKINFVGTLKIITNVAQNFDIVAIGLNLLHNYFRSSTKLLF